MDDRHSKGLVLTASGTVCIVAGVVLLLVPRGSGHHAEFATPPCTSPKTSGFFGRRCLFPQAPMAPATRAAQTPERSRADWSVIASKTKLGALAARFSSVRGPRFRLSLAHDHPRGHSPRYAAAPDSGAISAAKSDDIEASAAAPPQECSSAWQLSARLVEAEDKLFRTEHLLAAQYAEAVVRQEAANLDYLDLQRAHEHLRAELEAARSTLARRAAAAPEVPTSSSDDVTEPQTASAVPARSEQGARPGLASSHALEEDAEAFILDMDAFVDPNTAGDAPNVTAWPLDSPSDTQRACDCLPAPPLPSAEPLRPIWPHVLSATLALLASALRLQARRDRATWNEQRASLERRVAAAERNRCRADTSVSGLASPPRATANATTSASARESVDGRSSPHRVGTSCGDDWVDAGAETAELHALVIGESAGIWPQCGAATAATHPGIPVLGASAAISATSPLWGAATATTHGSRPLVQALATDGRSPRGGIARADRRSVGSAFNSYVDVRSLSSASDGGCRATSAASSEASAGASISVDEAEEQAGEPRAASLSWPNITAQSLAGLSSPSGVKWSSCMNTVSASETSVGDVSEGCAGDGLESCGSDASKGHVCDVFEASAPDADSMNKAEESEASFGLYIASVAPQSGRLISAAACDASACDASFVGEAEEPEVISPSPPNVTALAPTLPTPHAAGAPAATPKAGATVLVEVREVDKMEKFCARATLQVPQAKDDAMAASLLSEAYEDARPALPLAQAHQGGCCAQVEIGLATALPPNVKQAAPDTCGLACAHSVGAGIPPPAHEDSPPSVMSALPPPAPGLTLPQHLLNRSTPEVHDASASNCGFALACLGDHCSGGSHGAVAHTVASDTTTIEAFSASTAVPQPHMSITDFDASRLLGGLACGAAAAPANDSPAAPHVSPTNGSLSGPLIPDPAKIAHLDMHLQPCLQSFTPHPGESALLQSLKSLPPPERRQPPQPVSLEAANQPEHKYEFPPEGAVLPEHECDFPPVCADQPVYEYESPPEDEVNETIDLEDEEIVLILPLGTPPNSPPSQPTAASHSLSPIGGSAPSGPVAVASSNRLRLLPLSVSSAADAPRAKDVPPRIVAPPIRDDYF